MKKTAKDFRDDARKIRTRMSESDVRNNFEVEENFVTNWAGDLTARLAETKAAILEDGKTAIFTGLFEGNRRIKAKKIRTKFGTAWLLDDDEADLIARRGKKFLPTGENSRILRDLGLREAPERAPAWAELNGNGTGLSGNVWVEVFRTGDKWGGDAKLEKEEK